MFGHTSDREQVPQDTQSALQAAQKIGGET